MVFKQRLVIQLINITAKEFQLVFSPTPSSPSLISFEILIVYPNVFMYACVYVCICACVCACACMCMYAGVWRRCHLSGAFIDNTKHSDIEKRIAYRLLSIFRRRINASPRDSCRQSFRRSTERCRSRVETSCPGCPDVDGEQSASSGAHRARRTETRNGRFRLRERRLQLQLLQFDAQC